MTLGQIKMYLKSVTAKKAREKIEDLVMSAVAAQGDKKAINKTISEIEKSIDSEG